MTSRWSSPIPDIRCSPVSSSIVTFRVLSSFATCRSTSTSLGRSFMCFASTATVTTGSLACWMASKGIMSSMEETVAPTYASFRPVTAAILPAGICSTSSLSGPMKIPTCCSLFVFTEPDTLSSIPLFSVPLNNLPVDTSPAWGSIEIFVTINATSPSRLAFSISLPSRDSLSPCHITFTLSFWASRGLGRYRMIISFKTSWSGHFSASSFCFSSLQ